MIFQRSEFPASSLIAIWFLALELKVKNPELNVQFAILSHSNWRYLYCRCNGIVGLMLNGLNRRGGTSKPETFSWLIVILISEIDYGVRVGIIRSGQAESRVTDSGGLSQWIFDCTVRVLC